ncbi:hypothetical protein D8674_027671 [Pyrus ussuriensis x Pyrus communis]|uniref:Uncharacterized protein n=1 Tax=Pyrus ussuriensis x Pyrus communis TaxID=2448454 RepID=A0A5N5ICW9_9ROSA|nr:hypothetical protein D8674_027671 [Pyrus ussuriensis x Pyrus communis]
MPFHGRRILFEPENLVRASVDGFHLPSQKNIGVAATVGVRFCCIMLNPIALIIGTVLKTAFHVIRFVLYNATLLGLDFMGWFIGWMVRNVPAFWIIVALLLLVVVGRILRRWGFRSF